MSVFFGANPSIADNLVLFVDAANPRSYPGSGTTVSDLSVNQYSGTLYSGTGFSTANSGVFTFDGTNDYIGLPTITLSEFTIEIAFKFSATPYSSGQSPVGTIDGIYGDWFIGPAFQNALGFVFDFGTILVGNTIINSFVDSWFILTVASNSSGTYFYNNAILDGTRNIAGPTINKPVTIGRYGSGYFPGSVGYLKMYNRSLTDREIWANFSSVRNRYGL